MSALNRLRRIAPYGIILGFSAYLYVLTLHLNYERVLGRIGPGAWPRLILVLIMVVCAYQVLRLALARACSKAETVVDGLEEEADPGLLSASEKEHVWRVWFGVLLTFIYIFAFQVTGFFLGSFLYLAALMYVGGFRRIVPVLFLSLAVSLIFVFIFMKIVYVSLPVGEGPFVTVSVALMHLLRIR